MVDVNGRDALGTGLRHNLEFSNPAIASRDLDPVAAASITSVSMPRNGRFDDTFRSISQPEGDCSGSPGLDQVSSFVFRAPESEARADMSATLQSRCVSEDWISFEGRRIVIVPKNYRSDAVGVNRSSTDRNLSQTT